MKIIEGLKKIKDLQRKLDDLKEKIQKHSAYLSNETPVYPEQAKQVAEWAQACKDIIAEMLKIRYAIQKTNLETLVTIEINGEQVEHSIAEWIHRRRDLAALDMSVLKGLTDRGLREGVLAQSTGAPLKITIVRCYDPAQRDKMLEVYASEPSLVDARLEIVNAVTDLTGV